MAVKGVFASDQNIAGTQQNSFASAILQVYPTGSAPLLALSAGMPSSDEKSVVTTWFEENHLSGYINVTNNATTGTTLTVDDVSQIVAGAVNLIQSTGEYVFVSSISGSDLTVIRGFAGSTITSINGSSTPVPMQRITTAQEEGSAKPTSITNLGYPRFNYMQIIRNAWDATGTAKAVAYHTGNVVAKNIADAGMFHAEDAERAMLWSRKTIGVLNGHPFRTMDGLLTQITTNVSAQSTNTTKTDLDTFFQSVFSRNIKGKPNERIAFCGNTVLQTVNQIANLNTTTMIEPGETEFGMAVNTWITPFGTVKLMTHPLMNENPTWTKDLYVFHPGAIQVKYLRRTNHDQNDQNGQRAGADADFGVYTTEFCVEYHGEITGGVYTGIDTAAAG